MRILSRIIFVAMLAMAVIIIPLGAATIIMAIELGLFFEALSGMLLLCVYIALSLYEVREFISEIEWEQQEQNRIGGDEHVIAGFFHIVCNHILEWQHSLNV